LSFLGLSIAGCRGQSLGATSLSSITLSCGRPAAIDPAVIILQRQTG
jgi:hypothetical protein